LADSSPALPAFLASLLADSGQNWGSKPKHQKIPSPGFYAKTIHHHRVVTQATASITDRLANFDF